VRALARHVRSKLDKGDLVENCLKIAGTSVGGILNGQAKHSFGCVRPELKAALERLADNQHHTVSNYVEIILEQHVENATSRRR
jgi:hypothetical protein